MNHRRDQYKELLIAKIIKYLLQQTSFIMYED